MMPLLHADDATMAKLAARLVRCAMADAQRRYVVGVAGVGGAGKSTLARRLIEAVKAIRPHIAGWVPMDGFHLSNARLAKMGLKDRKGSPDTFDAEGYLHLLAALRDAQKRVVFPIYDRTLHEPVRRDVPQQTADADTRLIVTEGNYLLLDQPPWSELEHLLDETWWLAVAPDTARSRLIERHIRGGRSPIAAVNHYECSDAFNAKLILAYRRRPDLSLCCPNDG